MALRGQGSLQMLLGKPMGKRPPSKSSSRRSEDGSNQPQQAQQGANSQAKRHKSSGQEQKGVQMQKSVRSYFTTVKSASAELPVPSAAEAGADTAAGAGGVSGSAEDALLGPAALALPEPSTTADVQTEEASWVLHTKLVGRRHQAAGALPAVLPDAQLLLAREPDNSMDANAILVQLCIPDGACASLGHLPAVVSVHLAPLLDDGLVTVQVVASAPATGGSSGPVPLCLHLALVSQPDDDSSSGCSSSDTDGGIASSMAEARVLAALQAARAAQEQQQSGAVLCNNFDLVVEHVRRHDVHCLIQTELELLTNFQAMQEQARCLFLRLLLRKAEWYQLRTVAYADVPDAEQAGRQLVTAGLAELSTDAGADLTAAMESLPCPVLRAVLTQLVQPKGRGRAASSSASKAEVITAILGNSCIERLRKCIGAVAGPCLRILPAVTATFKRVQRLFFLNEGQDLSGFLATERGGLRYPRYNILCRHAPFPDRAALLAYEEALHQAAVLEDALQADDMEAAEASLHPALEAISSSTHKQVCWDVQHAPLPNSCSCSAERSGSDVSTLTSPIRSAVAETRASDGLASSTSSGSSDSHGSGCQPDAAAYPSSAGPCTSDAAQAPLPHSASAQCSSRPLFLARFHAAWVHAGMATVGVSLLEKQRAYQEAVELLQRLLGGNCCPSRRGLWWLRLSINLEHLGRVEDALETAETALADCWVRHGDRLALQRRVLRLGKPPRRWKRPSWAAAAEAEPRELVITGRPLSSTVGIKSRFYGVDDQQCSVEELALQHYQTAAGGGWQGVHTEGGVWMMLFGLLMWDILFTDMPDVFRSPFQTVPLDLDTDAFYPARSAAIDVRLQEIAVGEAGNIIGRHWDAHCGVMCRGVNWGRFTRDELLEIAQCVGGLGLSVVCRLLAEDHHSLTGGMPDLLLWKPEECVCKLSEVKGPRDRLSDQQRAWLMALASAELEVEVCKVIEPSRQSTTKQQR